MARQEFSANSDADLNDQLRAWERNHPGVLYERLSHVDEMPMQASRRYPRGQTKFPASQFLVIEYEIPDEKIYVDPEQKAGLRSRNLPFDYRTLREAVSAWRELPDEQKDSTTVRIDTGLHYTEKEVERLRYRRRKP
jgi:hypothetical protein